jgi:tetratricopeptide (TPR) repeat protein
MNGKNSEADKDFRKVIKIMEDEIKLNARNAQELHSYFFLASTWSALGQPEKALEYLKLMLKFESCPQRIVIWLDNFPMFDNIRQNPEFKKVFNELEAKYQKTHLQVGELLKEQGII